MKRPSRVSRTAPRGSEGGGALTSNPRRNDHPKLRPRPGKEIVVQMRRAVLLD